LPCFGLMCPTSPVRATESNTYFGYSGVNLGLGGFLSPQFALMFRASSTSFVKNDDLWSSSFVGGVLQFWPSDLVYVSAGPGIGVLSRNQFLSSSGSSQTRTGFALSLRAGIAVANYRHNSLRIGAETIASFLEDHYKAVGTGVDFEWQYF
jgi:hypothetical protein